MRHQFSQRQATSAIGTTALVNKGKSMRERKRRIFISKVGIPRRAARKMVLAELLMRTPTI